MICPNCNNENANEYATVCAYCKKELYQNINMDEKVKELSAKQKRDRVKAILSAILSVFLAVAVIIVAVIIPKPDDSSNSNITNSNNNGVTTTSPFDEIPTLGDSGNSGNGDEVNNSNGNDNNSNNNGGSSNEDAQKDDPNIMDSPEEILNYFNTNANRVKTEAKKVVKNYEDREIKKVEAPKALQSTAEKMVTTFMADDTDPIEYTTREEIQQNFQVPKQSYVSCLKLSDIEKIYCKDMGSYYEIGIMVKSEDNPSAGKGVGAAFDVIEPEEVEGKSDMVEDFSTRYSNCTVVAKFDKKTNRMTSANYMIPTKLMLTVNLAGTHEASIDMSFEKDYTITY